MIASIGRFGWVEAIAIYAAVFLTMEGIVLGIRWWMRRKKGYNSE